MLKLRKTGKRVVGGVGFLAVVGVLWLVPPLFEHDSLLARATRVTGERSWPARYFWLNDRDILTFKSPNATTFDAFRLDTKTGNELPLPELTKTFDSRRPDEEMRLSPDRQWLLWQGRDRFGASFDVRASSISGQTVQLQCSPREWTWLGDSHTLTKFCPESRLLMPRFNKPGRLEFPFVHLDGRSDPQCVIDSVPEVIIGPNLNIATLGGSRIVGLINGKRLLAANWAVDMKNAYLFDIDLAIPKKSNRYTVSVPGTGLTHGLVISPDGKRLTWIRTHYGFDSPFLAYLRQRAPWLVSSPVPRVVVSVSDLRGKSWTEVGSVTLQRLDLTPQERRQMTDYVQWTPDSKRLSFLYKNCLYTVPAD